MKKQGLSGGLCPPVFGEFSRGAALPSAAHGARSAAATELQRSRCCDGVAAATELRRPAPSTVALILRVASRRDALNEEPASFSLLLI